MANYFRCDISFMKEINQGGRLYSAKYGTEIPNGFIGFLGDYVSGSTEVRTLLAPTAELLKTKIPVIVQKPEINYSEAKKTDYAIGIFRNPANKPVPTVPFHEFDGIDLSQDYFDLTGKASGKTTEVEVGDIFEIQENGVVGTQLKYASVAPLSTVSKSYFKVIGVRNSHIATYVSSEGTRFPAPYKMVQLQIVLQ